MRIITIRCAVTALTVLGGAALGAASAQAEDTRDPRLLLDQGKVCFAAEPRFAGEADTTNHNECFYTRDEWNELTDERRWACRPHRPVRPGDVVAQLFSTYPVTLGSDAISKGGDVRSLISSAIENGDAAETSALSGSPNALRYRESLRLLFDAIPAQQEFNEALRTRYPDGAEWPKVEFLGRFRGERPPPFDPRPEPGELPAQNPVPLDIERAIRASAAVEDFINVCYVPEDQVREWRRDDGSGASLEGFALAAHADWVPYYDDSVFRLRASNEDERRHAQSHGWGPQEEAEKRTHFCDGAPDVEGFVRTAPLSAALRAFMMDNDFTSEGGTSEAPVRLACEHERGRQMEDTVPTTEEPPPVKKEPEQVAEATTPAQPGKEPTPPAAPTRSDLLDAAQNDAARVAEWRRWRFARDPDEFFKPTTENGVTFALTDDDLTSNDQQRIKISAAIGRRFTPFLGDGSPPAPDPLCRNNTNTWFTDLALTPYIAYERDRTARRQPTDENTDAAENISLGATLGLATPFCAPSFLAGRSGSPLLGEDRRFDLRLRAEYITDDDGEADISRYEVQVRPPLSRARGFNRWSQSCFLLAQNPRGAANCVISPLERIWVKWDAAIVLDTAAIQDAPDDTHPLANIPSYSRAGYDSSLELSFRGPNATVGDAGLFTLATTYKFRDDYDDSANADWIRNEIKIPIRGFNAAELTLAREYGENIRTLDPVEQWTFGIQLKN